MSHLYSCLLLFFKFQMFSLLLHPISQVFTVTSYAHTQFINFQYFSFYIKIL